MWFLRVAVIAALCGIGSLDIPDTPGYQKCANILVGQMKQELSSEMRGLNSAIANVSHKVDNVCGPQDNQGQVMQSSEILAIQTTLEDRISNSQSILETIIASRASKQDVTNSLGENNAVLTKAFKTAVEQQVEVSLASTNAELTGIKTALDQLTNETQERIANLEEMLTEILNATRLAPPTQPAPVPALPGKVYPCEDSTFSGNNHGACESAVKFKKCYQLSVAYHCCRTCTDNGQLPEMGPWRYMNDTRAVNTLNVLRQFTL